MSRAGDVQVTGDVHDAADDARGVVRIPITVIGGYLGAGKTTLLNRVLAEPGGRRIGVIVNDFGSIGIDAELLRSATTDDGASGGGIVNLANGCICCTLGTGLHEALAVLRSADPPPDHIVIEASGVADPAVAAAWGTAEGFVPGGVFVLAAGNTIARQIRDRYVGGEIRRQLAGADVVVVTKTDLCDDVDLARVEGLLAEHAERALTTDRSDLVDPAFVLSFRPGDVPSVLPTPIEHRYVTWAWEGGAVPEGHLHAVLGDLPVEIVRLKGIVALDDGRTVVVQVVGTDVSVEPHTVGADRSSLVAIARPDLDATALTNHMARR